MRSHYCGQLNKNLVDQEVTLCGWVNKRRDLGGLIFIDMRDVEGIVQAVIDPDETAIFADANKLRNEFCVKVTGIVRARPDSQINKDMATGEVELYVKGLEILNSAAPLPLDFNQENSEEARLRFRYLDLRRPVMNERIKFRSKVTSAVRRYLDDNAFLDIETPILTKATPEGARDYLVPSRTHKGQFFALPQSPQLFKQLLMVAGFDRYYQIVKCFRDEDLRADRQPEFTQIDIETTFMSGNDVMAMTEKMVRSVFNELLDVELGDFPSMTYAEAMRRFGSDKPDLRNPLELVDVADILKDVDFKVFSGPANDSKGRVAVIKVPGGASMTRKNIDGYTEFVGKYGAKGLAWIKVNDVAAGLEGLQSPIVKFLNADVASQIVERTGAKDGDILLFGSDTKNVVTDALGALRLKLGEDFGLIEDKWAPLWVVDFPMFEELEGGALTPLHHPFTAPSNMTPAELAANPIDAISDAYDMVLNGCELGGGSVRIHNQDMQAEVFKLLGISDEEAKEKFGFLLDALQYGAPPHAGLAFGLDRMVMLMVGADSIRDVMAFPKTSTAACPLTQAPGFANPEALADLGIQVVAKEDK